MYPPLPADLQHLHGLRPWLDDPLRRAHLMAFTLQTELLADPRTPFGAMARQGLLLDDATEPVLYGGDWGRVRTPYVPGSRPLLEAYIARVTTPGMSPAEKIVALCQSMQDSLVHWYPASPAFLYGESDEEVILKGGGHCSCRARLLCALAQVLGLDARPVLFWTWEHPDDPGALRGGHTVAEVRLDGRWAFFDPMCHFYCPRPDGTFASVLDIRREPELLTRLPAAAVEAMAPYHYPYAPDPPDLFLHYWQRYFHPLCPIAISRHEVMGPYTIRWNWATDDFRQRLRADASVMRKAVFEHACAGQLTADVYGADVYAFRRRIGFLEPRVPGYPEAAAPLANP